jgi:head-tail adaptor
MAYSAGLMNKRVTVAKRAAEQDATFGKSGQPKYEILGTFWMAEDFNRGVKSLREGALDAYDTVMFRCRFIKDIDRWCLLQYHGKWYQINSFNADYQDNQIQITATELANQQVNIVEPEPPAPPTPKKHEVEIYADAECTTRPEGSLTKVYAQINGKLEADVTFTNSETIFRFNYEDEGFVDYWMARYMYWYCCDYEESTLPKGTIVPLTLTPGHAPSVFSAYGDYSFGEEIENE